MEREYNSQQSSALDEQKKRFSEIRKLRKSVDMSQIEEHKKKLDKFYEEHEKRKIVNDPLKVSFKSKYHTSMTSRSRINED